MARRTILLLAALALIAGACSGSEPAASQPSSTPVASPTATPAPTATVTPLPEPTATAAPTPTPAPSEEELAVIAAWERYVVLSFEARSKEPSTEALDFETYMLEGALNGLVEAMEQDRAAGRYLAGPVSTRVVDVSIAGTSDAVIDGCIETDLSAFTRGSDAVQIEEGPLQLVARGRLVFTSAGWLVAASDFEAGQCEE